VEELAPDSLESSHLAVVGREATSIWVTSLGGGVALEVQSRISDGVVQLVAPVAVGHNALDVQVDVSCLSSDFRKGRVPHVCRMCASRASRELDSLARASITAPRASRQRCGRQVRGCIAET
jgi:hypothetical protein